MTGSLLSIHDSLLAQAPEGARHDADICPFCTDWALAESGIPTGYDRLDLAEVKAPYGDVDYADPGYQDDKVKRYPVDTEEHAKAAWSYIHQSSNAEKYSSEDLAKIRVKIQTALKKFGVEAENKEVEKTKKLADAKASAKAPVKSSTPTPKKKTDAASEGGTSKHMDEETMLKETHEALLDKAVRDATAALQTKFDELTETHRLLTETHDAASKELTAVKGENERLNGELDTAQVSLKTAQDEASSLKADLAARDDAANKATIASDRAAQVRNLGLFTEDYINDKASKWADVDEAAWNDRLEEWKALKGTTTTSTSSTTTDTASAMTGTREGGTGHEPTARRAILGLV